MQKQKKLHILNCTIAILLIIGFISSMIVNNYFTTPGESGDIGVVYLAGLFFIFFLFWIFMKWGEFRIESENI